MASNGTPATPAPPAPLTATAHFGDILGDGHVLSLAKSPAPGPAAGGGPAAVPALCLGGSNSNMVAYVPVRPKAPPNGAPTPAPLATGATAFGLLRTSITLGDFGASFSPLERILITANGNLQRIVSSFYASPVEVRVVYNTEIRKGLFTRQVRIVLLPSGDGTGRDAAAADGDATPWCFCTATSRITVTSVRMLEALASKRVGIGQLFRHFASLPTFSLFAVARGVQSAAEVKAALWSADGGGGADDIVHPAATDGIAPGGVHGSGRDGGDENQGVGSPFWRLYQLSSDGISCLIHEQFDSNVLHSNMS